MNSAPIEPLISTSDLDKIDVRIGTISLSRTWAHSPAAFCCLWAERSTTWAVVFSGARSAEDERNPQSNCRGAPHYHRR